MRSDMGSRRGLSYWGLFLGACTWTACSLFNGASGSSDTEAHVPTVDNNVCKRLREEVVIYAVFVDSKAGGPWSTHDIRSTLDSIECAVQWIERQAHDRGIDLHIQVSTHDKAGVVPVRSELPRGGLTGAIHGINGMKALDGWADKAGRQVLGAFPADTARITLTKITPKDRERLIARVRDIHGTDNVGLMLFVNNYYKDETSVALHTASTSSIEYAAVAFKRPAVIAHEFLHLFGALDLYVTPFDGKKEERKRKEFAMKEFPKEIMAFPYRGLDSLEISPLTEYLIGWRRELDEKYLRMLTSKKIRLAKY